MRTLILLLFTQLSFWCVKGQTCTELKINDEVVDMEGIADKMLSEYKGTPNKKELDYHLKSALRSGFDINFDEGLMYSFESDSLLSASEKSGLAFSDIAFWGKVVAKDRAKPIDQCLYYKTAYKVVVNKLAFSIYDIKVGDTIEMRSMEGIVGEACIEGGENFHVILSHYSSYDLNSEHFFGLSNTTFFARAYFYHKAINSSVEKYNDPLWSCVFSDNATNRLNNLQPNNEAIMDFYNKLYKP